MRAVRFLPLLPALALGACTSTEILAKPDLTARIDQPPMVMSGCLNDALVEQFPGAAPDLQQYGSKSEISLYAPRGGLIAFITVEPHPNGKSIVKFYNGDLYWPTHQVSGVYPDMARDNWHRVERAMQACAPVQATVPAEGYAPAESYAPAGGYVPAGNGDPVDITPL